MTKPLVYVAGPITGNPWGCVRQAVTAAAELNDVCDTYLPQLSVLHEMIEPRPYEQWVAQGLAMVARCDAVLRLHGDSPGTDRECVEAERRGIPVFYDAAAVRSWAEAHQ